MENIQNITIDIMNNKYSDYIYAKQYDVGRIINFTVTDNGKVIDTTDVFCTYIQHSDKAITTEMIDGSTDGTFQLVLSHKQTEYSGKIPYQLILSTAQLIVNPDGTIDWGDGSQIIGTVNGIILVEPCVIDEDSIIDQIDETIMDELMKVISRAGSYITNAREAAVESETHSVISKSYAVGGTDVEHEGVDDDVDNSKYYSKISKSYAVGGTDYDHDGIDDDIDNAKYYYNETSKIYDQIQFSKLITLYQSDWDSTTKQQIVDIDGVVADEDVQLIVVRPKSDSIVAYAYSNVLCIEQLDGQLKFSCDYIPNTDLNVYVGLQDLEVIDRVQQTRILYDSTEPSSAQMKENDIWIQPY